MKVSKKVRRAAEARILLLTKGYPPTVGGIETYSDQVVRAYLRAGLRVSVLTQTEGVAGWSTRSTPDGDIDLWNSGPGGQAVVFRRLFRVAREIKKSASFVGVHSTTWRVGLVAQMVFGTLPRMVTVHGREVLNWPTGARPIMRWVLDRATAVLCVSGPTRAMALEAVRPKRKSRWVIAHNGLTDGVGRATTKGRSAPGDPVNILSLCRLVPRKNIARAVEAVSMLEPSLREKIDFRIAGQGPQSGAVYDAIEQGNLGDTVSMLGYVAEDDVPALYDWADIFVHPHSHIGEGTEFEGFGISIADAMAHGCTVISGTDGGPRDFVIDGQTGVLVDGNDVASIASAISRLVADVELLQQISARGQAHAREHFSWDAHVGTAIDAIGLPEEAVS